MNAPAVRTRGLAKHFGAVQALHPLDLEVGAGTTLAVLGPNGAGKSTLLRLLAGLARPSAGSLELGDGRGDRRARRRQVGLLAHATFLYPALSARENLVLAGRLFGVADPAGRARELIEQLELAPFAERPAGALSRGLAQRVSIARALVHDPPLLLLDEPFSGLDPRAARTLALGLSALHDRARTTLLVTHDLARAAELADRALLLVRGRGAELPAPALRDAAALEAHYRAALEPGAPEAR